MEIHVKNSIPFFFVTTLLIFGGSSYALPSLLGAGKSLWRFNLPPTADVKPVNPHPRKVEDDYREISKPSNPTKRPPPSPKVRDAPPSSPDPKPEPKLKDGPQRPAEETEIASRLFGPDGAKNFRTGWKVGKKIYSVIGMCEEFKDFFTCPLPPYNCSKSESELESVFALYCVVTLAENGLNNTCHESCGVPVETPCSYVDGALISGCKLITAISPAPSHAYIHADPPAYYAPGGAESVGLSTNYGIRIIIVICYLICISF